MARTEATPWLDLAVSRIGIKEKKGKDANSDDILQMFADVGHDDVETDETAWCAVSLGSCLVKTGHAIPPREVNMMARSFLKYGIKLDSPKVGAIGVFKRGKPPFGHVGIVEDVDWDKRTVTLVSGNVGNQQKRETKSFDEALGWRWPIKVDEKPPVEKPLIKTAVKSKSVWAQITAMATIWVGYVTDWAFQAWDWVLGLVALLPTMASEGSATVESSRTMASWFNFPMDKVVIGAATVGMLVTLVRHIQDKRRVSWD